MYNNLCSSSGGKEESCEFPVAAEWKQNRCQLVQASCATEGPLRYTLDVQRDAPQLFCDIG